jgi:spore maturation protein SpmB
VAIQIVPYLIAILVAISVFRTTGCMDVVVGGIGAVVVALGLNADFVPALPVGLMKTLSGSGARGLMVDVMKAYGVDSFQGSWRPSSRAPPRPRSTCWRCTLAASTSARRATR